jgi:hypothetical protein
MGLRYEDRLRSSNHSLRNLALSFVIPSEAERICSSADLSWKRSGEICVFFCSSP